jgi:hypothetical protein
VQILKSTASDNSKFYGEHSLFLNVSARRMGQAQDEYLRMCKKVKNGGSKCPAGNVLFLLGTTTRN